MTKENTFLKWANFFILLNMFISFCSAQELESSKESYTFGAGEKLQITVHIWGEIVKPGQYIVPDGTNVLELISLAGGPNEFSSLSSIRITRTFFHSEEGGSSKTGPRILSRKQIYKINLNRFLKDRNDLKDPYVLSPGDVVHVNRNLWFRFQTLLRTVYQVAVIAQGLYWFARLIEI